MIRQLTAIAVATLLLAGCSGAPSGSSVGGEVVTSVTLTIKHDSGTEAQPIPNPPLADNDWPEICRGNPVLMAGSTRWYYAPDGEPSVLENRQVTIKDASGSIVGLPTLTLASGKREGAGFGSCHWSFELGDFTSDSDFFTVEVEGVPGVENVSREELLGGLSLTIG